MPGDPGAAAFAAMPQCSVMPPYNPGPWAQTRAIMPTPGDRAYVPHTHPSPLQPGQPSPSPSSPPLPSPTALGGATSGLTQRQEHLPLGALLVHEWAVSAPGPLARPPWSSSLGPGRAEGAGQHVGEWGEQRKPPPRSADPPGRQTPEKPAERVPREPGCPASRSTTTRPGPPPALAHTLPAADRSRSGGWQPLPAFPVQDPVSLSCSLHVPDLCPG